jgi:undecaprenyl-diphosphatase
MSIDNISFAVGEWNKDAFEFINSKMANGFFDIIMPMARQPIIWVPLYVFFAALIFINFKKQALYIYIFAAATIFFSDQLSAHVLKVFFAHPRPCADYTMMGRIRMLVDCGPGFSFPSSHATNHFAFAVFIIT